MMKYNSKEVPTMTLEEKLVQQGFQRLQEKEGLIYFDKIKITSKKIKQTYITIDKKTNQITSRDTLTFDNTEEMLA
jgi:hypothetical protein